VPLEDVKRSFTSRSHPDCRCRSLPHYDAACHAGEGAAVHGVQGDDRPAYTQKAALTLFLRRGPYCGDTGEDEVDDAFEETVV
jgi:hypothetical protein